MARKITGQTKVKVDGFDYDVTQAQTDTFKIEDTATGKPVILRHFEYRYPPVGKVVPTKEQLLTPTYVKHLQNLLWADALEMIADPKVVFYPKGFRIFVTCQAKKGNIIPYEARETMRPLQETLQQDYAKKGK